MSKSIVHISHSGGHRKAYLDLFVYITGFKPLIGPISRQNLITLVKAEKVFFGTVGVSFRRYWTVSLLRSLLGKPTTAIFIGAMEYCTDNRSSISFIDKYLAKIWKLLPRQTILAIIPYNVEPTLRQVTNNYIYDPQMWDMWLDSTPPVFPKTPLSDLVESKREGKKVLIFIGIGSKRKSFEELVKFAEANKDKFYVVVAGQVSVECAADAAKLSALDMTVENRFITDEELLSLYGIADYAWCFYAPEYDQASGIFGRAIQLGVTPVVRSGSIIARISENMNIPSIKLEAVDFNETVESTARLMKVQDDSLTLSERQFLYIKLRDDSLKKLNKALGFIF